VINMEINEKRIEEAKVAYNGYIHYEF
jgi:hypothetical protein